MIALPAVWSWIEPSRQPVDQSIYLSTHPVFAPVHLQEFLATPPPALARAQNAEGGGLAPFDCWLALRGLKTMALRMERSAASAARIAAYLASHPLVKKVNYASLPSHQGSDIHARQATSGGSLLSFETGSLEASRIIVEETALYKITVSFGNVVSLISLPCYMSHASIPAEVRAARGLPDDLVRISVGIEDVEDLISDHDASNGGDWVRPRAPHAWHWQGRCQQRHRDRVERQRKRGRRGCIRRGRCTAAKRSCVGSTH